MRKPSYPFTGTSFKAHDLALHALAVVIILSVIATAGVMSRMNTTLPDNMYLVLSVSLTALILTWIVLMATFNDKQTSNRIHHLEQLESVLLQVVTKVDRNTTMDPAQKRFFLETYINALREIDWSTAEAHLDKGGFNGAGAVMEILEELRRETGTELKSKIDADTPKLFEETSKLNQTMEDYRLMGVAIRTLRPMPDET